MMTSFDVTVKRKVDWNVLPLDPRLFSMLDAEREFFKAQTGIQSDDRLREHVIKMQEEAYAFGVNQVIPYPCIRVFSFLRLNITRVNAYQKALSLAKIRPSAIFLEVGPGFGTDCRKLTSDGYPLENVIVNDINEGFWDAGHKLFKSSPQSFPVKFVPGDFFDLTEGIHEKYRADDRPDLGTLRRSLLPLKGRVSIIYAALFFHLFDEQRGRELARRLACLLAPERGSLIFGLHLGAPQPVLQTTPAGRMFCHSPDSWTSMWEEVFPAGTVKIEARIAPVAQRTAKGYAGEKGASDIWVLIWSIERM